MSTLVLVRHGQVGGFGGDGLSTTGEEQARRLGGFWARHGDRFDAVFTGTLPRQIRTAEIAGAALRASGLPWPEAEPTSDLDEYDAGRILERLVPLLASRDGEFQKLVDAYRGGAEGPERNRHFQRMFEVVMSGWFEGGLEASEVETWAAFRGRVERALERVTSGNGRGRRIAAFTSGGPIGVIVRCIVGAPERAALELNWRVRNCSLTEITFSGSRLSLDSFNALPHLEDRLLWTYR